MYRDENAMGFGRAMANPMGGFSGELPQMHRRPMDWWQRFRQRAPYGGVQDFNPSQLGGSQEISMEQGMPRIFQGNQRFNPVMRQEPRYGYAGRRGPAMPDDYRLPPGMMF